MKTILITLLMLAMCACTSMQPVKQPSFSELDDAPLQKINTDSNSKDHENEQD